MNNIRIAAALTLLACAATPALAQSGTSRARLVARLDSISAAPVKAGDVAGLTVAVVRGRDTLLMRGYGFADLENRVAVTPQTVFRIGSITKQFTSAAVMQLVEQGRIGLDDDITKYIPNAPVHGRRILVRHLLNHTSGIPSYTDIGPAFGAVMRRDLPHDSLVAVVAGDSLMFEPGSHFYYNNTGYYLLGMLLEKVTGKPYAEYVAERLFTPNGLTATYYCDTKRLIPHRAQGYDREQQGLVNTEFISMDLPFAAGSLCSTPRDLVRWSSRLAAGKVVSPASYREMTTPVRFVTGRPMTYGFGLTADTIGTHRSISHGGGINGFSALLTLLPADSLTVAVITNTGSGAPGTVTDAIVRAVLGMPAASSNTPKDVALSAEDRAQYVGTYEQTRPDGTRRRVEVIEENGALMFRVDSTHVARLRSQGDNTFVIAPPLGGHITFDVVRGRATGFVTAGGRPLEAVRVP
ncbi:MAG TPA: serine hydrolase domain-containing protein [Gemmatimonadaceae bacterium]|nr:serine hydrolase domain-containing protein [Gemmatimonadaceae bacterium]